MFRNLFRRKPPPIDSAPHPFRPEDLALFMEILNRWESGYEVRHEGNRIVFGRSYRADFVETDYAAMLVLLSELEAYGYRTHASDGYIEVVHLESREWAVRVYADQTFFNSQHDLSEVLQSIRESKPELVL